MKKKLLIALVLLSCAAYGQEKYRLEIYDYTYTPWAGRAFCGEQFHTYISIIFDDNPFEGNATEQTVYRGNSRVKERISGTVYSGEFDEKITKIRFWGFVHTSSSDLNNCNGNTATVKKEKRISATCVDATYEESFSHSGFGGASIEIKFDYRITPILQLTQTNVSCSPPFTYTPPPPGGGGGGINSDNGNMELQGITGPLVATVSSTAEDNTRTADAPLNIQAPTGFDEEAYNWQYAVGENGNLEWKDVNWNWPVRTTEHNTYKWTCPTPRGHQQVGYTNQMVMSTGTEYTNKEACQNACNETICNRITTKTTTIETAKKDKLTASFADFLSADELAANYYKNIWFRVKPCSYSCDADMPPVSYVLIAPAPEIEATPLRASCPRDDSIKLRIKFKKEALVGKDTLLLTLKYTSLAADENTSSVAAQIHFKKTTDGEISPSSEDIQENQTEDEDEYACTWTLPSGPQEYELSYQILQFEETTAHRNPSELYQNTITFEVPDTLTFSATPHAVACHGDSTGRIALAVQGGTPGRYQYKYRYSPPSRPATAWTDFSTGHTLADLPAGTYTLQVRDTNNCAALQAPPASAPTPAPDTLITVTITQPAAPLQVSLTPKHATYYGAQNGAISITIKGGTQRSSPPPPPYTTTWKKDGASFLPENDTLSLNYGAYSGKLDSLFAGAYTLIARDSNNCTASDTTTVTQPDSLSVTLRITQQIGCNPSNASQPSNRSSNGKLEATAEGGVSGYTYRWYHSTANGWDTLANRTDSTLTDLSPGTYRVEVSDAVDSLKAYATTTLTAPDTLTFSATPHAVACHGDSTGRIALAVQGGTPGRYQYKYQYSPPSGLWTDWADWADFSTGHTLATLPAGAYTLQVQDTNRCAALQAPSAGAATKATQITVTITQPAAPLKVSLKARAATYYGAQNGHITATLTGGTQRSPPPYTTTWEKNGTPFLPGKETSTLKDDTYSIQLDSLGAGRYTLMARDSNTCTASADTTVTQPEPLSVTLRITRKNACPPSPFTTRDEEGVLQATAEGGDGGYTYHWQNRIDGDWKTLADRTDRTLTDLPPGTYRVEVSDTVDSPKAYADTTLTAPDTLTFSATPQAVACHGDSTGSIALAAQGGTPGGYRYKYQYSPPNTTSYTAWTAWADFSTGQATTLADLPAGAYTLQVQDTNRCAAQPAPPAGAPTPAPDMLVTVAIPQPAAPLAIALVAQDAAFYGGTNGHITATVTGGTPPYTTTWAKENAPFSGGVRTTHHTTDGHTDSLSHIGIGRYTLMARDENTCTASASASVTQPEPLTVTLRISQPISCSNSTAPASARDGQLTATAAGGVPPYTYSWYRKAATGVWKALLATSEGGALSNIGPGTYKVLLTDANHPAGSPTKEATATLQAPPPIEISLEGTAASCQNGKDGKIEATITGGTAPLKMAWNTTLATTTLASTTMTRDTLTSGQYIVIITDKNKCTVKAIHQLGSPKDLAATITAHPPTCPSSNDGTLTVNTTGGVPPYTYSWETLPNQTDSTLTGLSRGVYSCTITDANGCLTHVDKQLEDPAAIRVSLGADRTLCNGQTHTIDITVAAAPEATYLWASSDGPIGTSPTAALTGAGTYTATLTTAAGCVSTDTIKITTLTTSIDANFMITTQAFANEDLVLVNTSEPLGERTKWSFPPLVTTTAHTAHSRILRFAERGVYAITMRTFQGPCYQDYTKSIVVDEARDMPEVGDLNAPLITSFDLYPNPSTGIFTLSVTLSKVAAISLRLFNMITPTAVDERRLSESSSYTEEYRLSLPGGMYFMLLEVGKERQIRKVIAQ